MDIISYIFPCLLVFASSVAFGIVFNLRGKRLFLAALGGTIGWAVYLISDGIYTNDVPQYFLAAVAVSTYSEIMARTVKIPATVFLVISSIPLVPGASIYFTMKSCISGEIYPFIEKLMYTFGVAGAIALGVFAVTSITRLIFGFSGAKK